MCTNAREAIKKHGLRMAEKIHQRIDEISAADTVEEIDELCESTFATLKAQVKETPDFSEVE